MEAIGFSLMLHGLPGKATEAGLRSIFSDLGFCNDRIARVHIPSRYPGASGAPNRGYAFVDCDSVETAEVQRTQRGLGERGTVRATEERGTW